MTDNGYLIWMIATAVMTIAVLTIGTLASAGILRRRDRRPQQAPPVRPAPEAGETDGDPRAPSAPTAARTPTHGPDRRAA